MVWAVSGEWLSDQFMKIIKEKFKLNILIIDQVQKFVQTC